VWAKCLTGEGVLRAIRERNPDIAVLDIVMPDMGGLDVIGQIAREKLPTKVIFLTANATDAHILAIIEHGARGFLMKDAAIGELATCIRAVANGERYLPPEIVTAAVEREIGRRAVAEQFARVLSGREREVLLLIAEGLPNKEVARRLSLSDGTVRIHMHNIYQKTGIASRPALTAMALAHRKLLVKSPD
jgi:two-component system nitrate/nitrite response regulator NarL